MLNYRTDLALEARELWREKTASELPPGARSETRTAAGRTVETLEIASPEAAEALGQSVPLLAARCATSETPQKPSSHADELLGPPNFKRTRTPRQSRLGER